MTGRDLTSARLAPPPLPPLPDQAMAPEALLDLGRRVAARTWQLGLPAWFWGEGVALIGLVRLAHAAGEPTPIEVRRWLDGHLAHPLDIGHVNNVAPGIAAVLAAEEEPAYLGAVAPLARWVQTSPSATRDANGALEHWPDGVWADTTYMAGVFLTQFGAATGDRSVMDEGARQLIAHAELLQSPSGLFAHGSHRGETIPCHWGRANAWCALAAVEYLELAASTADGGSELAARVCDVLVRQLVALADCQPDHGVWSVLVDDDPECAGIVETSAAAGLAAAMLRAGRIIDDLPAAVTAAGWRAARGALAYVDDSGALTRVSAGTILQLIPFGYSVIRDDRPQLWGQGLALDAIAAAIAGHQGSR